MAARVLDGKALAARMRHELTAEFENLKQRGHPAHLVSLSVGSDESSDWYVNNQKKAAAKLGVAYTAERIPADSTSAQVQSKIREICHRPDVTGMILQRPVPAHLDGNDLARKIDPEKDVEGVDPENLGRLMLEDYHNVPCTARAAVELAQESGVDFDGKHAVVLGRSIIVGKPTAVLLLNLGCTVTVCHLSTPNVPELSRQADILVTAMGSKAGQVKGDWLKPGAIVVDIATIPTENGYKGDCDWDSIAPVASWASPVPGGVGSVTTQILFKNLLETLKRSLKA
jgi:methylenetetrahydrofolate dehydrogenase (NADP+) / methenyltetrahydrofolate cyclohydrolase